MFDWFGFNQTSKYVSNSTLAKQLNPNKKGDQAYSDTSPYKESEYSLDTVTLHLEHLQIKNKLEPWRIVKKWAKPGLFLFILFFSLDKYSTNLIINDKSLDGVLGTRTRGGRMVGADESTELWRQPLVYCLHFAAATKHSNLFSI